MTVDPNNVKSIFIAASEKPPAERGEFVEKATAGDAALRARVEALLQAHDNPDSFLQEPAAEFGGTIDLSPAENPLAEHPGTLIGPYKLLEQIGEGGMGVVYMADQQAPVRRRVALKIIKAGMDTRQVIARFEAERQALALMDHSNIARVLDAGATETGRPYFVMELVRGIPITEYCDQNNLPVHERLELFVQVCSAVQHAHQKGIIHRDLKPSNVLVTLNDGRSVPKVIDFGVAKATGQQLTEKTLFTAFAQMVGTPLYMSPEQAEMTSLDIDTRSDIYSLGVLLYELLTSTTPFDQQRMRSAAFDEIRRIIREEEPPKPSTRLSTLGETRTATAAHRQVDAHRLGRLLKGDLDWIVMKALEKDRARRYDTAGNFAADVLRHLNDQPVEACPPTRRYRLKKFIRRNKAGVLAGSAVAAALIAGLILASIGLVHANRQTQIARTQAARSDEVATFLKEMLQAVGPSVALGRDTTMLREIADRTADRLKKLGDQPVVEAELCTTLGNVYLDLGEFARAKAMHSEALRLCKATLGSEHPVIAASLHNLGEALRQDNQFDESADLFRQALAMRRKVLGNAHADVAQSLFSLGMLFNRQAKWSDAEKHFREALAIQRKILTRDDPAIAATLRQFALTLASQGKHPEAEMIGREALAMDRKAGGASPTLAHSLGNLGYVLRGEGKLAEAEPLLREALAVRRQLLAPGHPDLYGTVMILADCLRRQREFEEADVLCREALQMQKKRYGDHSFRLKSPLFTLGLIAENQNKFQEAEQFYRQVLALDPSIIGYPSIPLTEGALNRVLKEIDAPSPAPDEKP